MLSLASTIHAGNLGQDASETSFSISNICVSSLLATWRCITINSSSPSREKKRNEKNTCGGIDLTTRILAGYTTHACGRLFRKTRVRILKKKRQSESANGAPDSVITSLVKPPGSACRRASQTLSKPAVQGASRDSMKSPCWDNAPT